MIAEISKFVDELDDNKMFKKFMTYYKKNQYNNSFIRFDICYDKNIKIRTNSVCEGFHRLLNHRIEFQKPKLSLVCDVLKQFTIEAFHLCVESLVITKYSEVNDYNIFAQCYDYLFNFHKKYHKELEFDDIKNLSKDPEKNIDNITITMLSLFKDSYVKRIKSAEDDKDNLSNNKDPDLEEENINSEEEIIKEISEGTKNIILSDDKEIESYDETCEKEEQDKKRKKRSYNEIKNTIMDSLINFNQSHSINKAKFKSD